MLPSIFGNSFLVMLVLVFVAVCCCWKACT